MLNFHICTYSGRENNRGQAELENPREGKTEPAFPNSHRGLRRRRRDDKERTIFFLRRAHDQPLVPGETPKSRHWVIDTSGHQMKLIKAETHPDSEISRNRYRPMIMIWLMRCCKKKKYTYVRVGSTHCVACHRKLGGQNVLDVEIE